LRHEKSKCTKANLDYTLLWLWSLLLLPCCHVRDAKALEFLHVL
jgi:hypothetical protein